MITRIGQLLLIISLLCSLSFGQATKIRTTGTLPATCVGGSPSQSMDFIAVCAAGTCTVYLCTSTNNWDQIITAAVALTWTASTGSPDSYNLYRASISGGPYTQIQTGLTNTAAVDFTVAHNTTYYYVTTAVNTNGESIFSNEVPATTTP